MTLFPSIANPRRVRALHPARARLMASLKRQATVVRDHQVRKLNLTQIAVNWKGAGFPQPGPDDPLYASYRAIRHAERTLERWDILLAYRACAAYVGAILRETGAST